MLLNINTKEVARFTNTLEQLHRSALPNAVRYTLTGAAFDVKGNTMLESAKSNFIHRQPNFFKANSKVEKAQGWDIGQMQATVGFLPLGGTNQAVDDLEEQEHGGKIGGRAFIPLKQARTGTSWTRQVKRNNRIGQIRSKIVDAKDAKGGNSKEQFTKSALHAGKGGFVLGDRVNGAGNRILFEVRSLKRIKGNTVIKSVPIMAVKGGRQVMPKATHFMRDASLRSAGKMDSLYIQYAEKQIAKYR